MDTALDYPTASLARHWQDEVPNSHKYNSALAEYLDANTEQEESSYGNTEHPVGYLQLFVFHDVQNIGDTVDNASYACILRTNNDGFVTISHHGEPTEIVRIYDALLSEYAEDDHLLGADE